MLITSIELENIKSYKQVTVNFQRGTTAISGSNGAGKTTLVEAIGFALFDSMPYKQDQFVREGEKYGRVVVRLEGNDDRPYVVERRCGSGASWTLYDTEADLRLEQRADVQDKLHELFGVERERSLENLFHDALGVPQGTFTSIFLQAPRLRKQTFDVLLQIENYTTASNYLLDAQKQYKEQLLVQEREIQRLTFETRDLPEWYTTLKDARALDQELKERNLWSTRRRAEQQTYFDVLKQRQKDLQACQKERERSELLCTHARQQFAQAEQALDEARTAHQIVQTNQADYQQYRQAEARLLELRRDERERNTLLKNQADLKNTLSTTHANIQNLQQRLEDVARARQRILDLLPAVEQQNELDMQIRTLDLEAQRYEELRIAGGRLYKLREKARQDQAEASLRITEIEPLLALADLHNERVANQARLRAQRDQRTAKHLQLEKGQRLLQERLDAQAQTAARLRQIEDAIAKIEAHRQEAEEYPRLQLSQLDLERQEHHLRGNIESYTDSRERSAGGQCPLLHQTCLNIKQQGLVSLETYFDGLLSTEQSQLAEITGQLAQITRRSAGLKKYAEDLNKLGRYADQREGYAEQSAQLEVEIQRQSLEVEDLRAEWELLQHIDQAIEQADALLKESQQADRQTRQLPGLMSQVEQLQIQIEQYTTEFEERRQEAEQYKQSKELLRTRQDELAELDDPRSKIKAAQETIQLEASYQQRLRETEEQARETGSNLEALTAQLEIYAYLDRSISSQEVTRERAEVGHQLYLKHVQVAERLPERDRACIEARGRVDEAEQRLAGAEETYQQASLAFNEQEFYAVEEEIKGLEQDITRLASEMQNLQRKINELEGKIAAAEALLIQLAAAEKEKQTLEELATMMEQFRKLIKDAAPFVLKAMLNDISAEANRIFGEIMGDRSAQLTWTDEYEISILRQGIKRSFIQLSGGEQMSAALAVRLALLKKLSTINIAFFDEPTQNMDEKRRANLAEQIRRVRGFDQLLVISHDDTFEQGLDSLIRLQKTNGQTLVRNEDDDPTLSASLAEQVNVYAS
jgi:DNA repair protein SbcC/Rad50